MELITLTDSNSDSFLVKISGEERDRHILIDGGYRQDARRALALIESAIEKNKQIDLVVLTHVDTDHINGLLAIFNNDKVTSSTIGKVLFNVPHNDSEMVALKEKTTQCGYHDGNKLLKIILDKDIPLEKAVQGDVHFIDGDIEIKILAPNSTALEKDHKAWRDTNIGYEAEPEYDKDMLINEVYQEDEKPQNVSSIVCLIEANNKRILMCGDSVPSQILGGVKGITPVDLLKIPHHGSKYNINSELLSTFPSKKFLIPGSRTGYPNHYTIALIEDISENSIVYAPCRSWVHKNKLNKDIGINFESYEVGTEIHLC